KSPSETHVGRALLHVRADRMGTTHPNPMTIEKPMTAVDLARGEIDRLDRDLLKILSERMRVVGEVGRLKGEGSERRLLDPDREQALLGRWRERAEAQGLSGNFAGRVLREVLRYSRRAQEQYFIEPQAKIERAPLVGYQGDPHSYSDLAAAQLFETRSSAGSERIGYRTFAKAVDALKNWRVDYVLLPVENSIVGSIGGVGQLLDDDQLFIVDEETWAVEHVLAVRPQDEGKRITHVRSHPVALGQCSKFLAKLPLAEAEPWHDTAGAAASLAESDQAGVAAISSEEAALAHGLTIVQRGIADQPTNLTRFLLLAREEETAPRELCAKTSLVLALDHQRGALARVLETLSKYEINLTRIESRPDPQTPWSYRFFIDLEGHRHDEPIAAALDDLRKDCNMLRVLGSYPMRTTDGAHLRTAATPAAIVNEVPIVKPPKASAPAFVRPQTSIVPVGDVRVGSDVFTMILGPCAVESRNQIHESAEMVKRAGAAMLRGGAFKPRTSPHSFQGLGQEGLDLLREAGSLVELPVVTELMRIEDLAAVVEAADVIQVGARNMQNFSLLRALGHVDRPVLLKRGMSATVDELLAAAEYITAGGNQRVILCERGIRTFETSTRSTLDLGAVAVLKTRTSHPVLVDPSHAAGVRHLVIPLALAAAAAGADGLIVEAHPNPMEALCDKDQALTREDVDQLFHSLRPILASQGRRL
ncbi:MAG: 3-deoxy-7-phosphoheptulonate synthase, partial [Planctomycetota bacterium]